MTFENRSLLLVKISFLAVLTTLIVLAGNFSSHSQLETAVQTTTSAH